MYFFSLLIPVLYCLFYFLFSYTLFIIKNIGVTLKKKLYFLHTMSCCGFLPKFNKIQSKDMCAAKNVVYPILLYYIYAFALI